MRAQNISPNGLEVSLYHLIDEKVLFNKLLVIENPGIGMPPILGFRIGKNGQDPGIRNPGIAITNTKK